MAITRKPYFYDRQMARLLVQVMSCFAGYQVRTGKQRDGKHRFIDVPIIYGGYDRVAQWIIAGGSENTVIKLPVMALDIVRWKQSDENRRSPQHVETYYWQQRAKDANGDPTTEPGTRMQMERYMPVPYDIGLKLTLWTSNQDQGFQICEQIATQFNPEIDIQFSNSPGDWTFISSLKFDGEFIMKRASVSPDAGGGDGPEYHLYEMSFSTVFYLNPPVITYPTEAIEEVHVSFRDMTSAPDISSMDEIEKIVIRSEEDPEDEDNP